MQTLLFSLILAGSLATSATLVNDPLIVRSKVFENALEITIANLEQEPATVTLRSLTTNRRIFHDRVAHHNGYSYNLNLEDLHRGRYLLTVKKGETERNQVILVSRDGVMCSDWK